MKDAGLYIGAYSFTFLIKLLMGTLYQHGFLGWFCISFMFIGLAIIGGVLGAVFQEIIIYIREKWTGKIKEQKQSLLEH